MTHIARLQKDWTREGPPGAGPLYQTARRIESFMERLRFVGSRVPPIAELSVFDLVDERSSDTGFRRECV